MEASERMLDQLVEDARRQSALHRTTVVLDLIVGVNRIHHGLGRAYAGYTITPTALSATFAHALSTEDNPHKDRDIWIEVSGTAQPRATVEIF